MGRRRRRTQSNSFILVPDEDARSDVTQSTQATSVTDLESLATTHECVRTLLEQNKTLTKALLGVRLLLRDPSARLIQRVARGIAGRARAARKLAAAVKIQSAARASLETALFRMKIESVVALQAHVRARKACAVARRLREDRAAVVVGAAARRFLALTTTVAGTLLSKTRKRAEALLLEGANHAATTEALAATEAALAATKRHLAGASRALAKKDGLLTAAKKLVAATEATLERAAARGPAASAVDGSLLAAVLSGALDVRVAPRS